MTKTHMLPFLRKVVANAHLSATGRAIEWRNAFAEVSYSGETMTDFGALPGIQHGHVPLKYQLASCGVYLKKLPAAVFQHATDRCPWCHELSLLEVHNGCEQAWQDHLAD